MLDLAQLEQMIEHAASRAFPRFTSDEVLQIMTCFDQQKKQARDQIVLALAKKPYLKNKFLDLFVHTMEIKADTDLKVSMVSFLATYYPSILPAQYRSSMQPISPQPSIPLSPIDILSTPLKDLSRKPQLDHTITDAALKEDLSSLLKTDEYSSKEYASHWAILAHEYLRLGYTETFKFLLEQGKVDLSYQDTKKTSTFLLLSSMGLLSLVPEKTWQSISKELLNQANQAGLTPLLAAIKEEHRSDALRLLKAEADPNSQDKDGDTALIKAARLGQLELVQAILNNSASSLNQSNNDGNTALLEAVKLERQDVVQALLASPDIDIFARNDDGESAFHWACYRKNDAITKMLVQKAQSLSQHLSAKTLRAATVAALTCGNYKAGLQLLRLQVARCVAPLSFSQKAPKGNSNPNKPTQ